jgi:hypothetical protein
MTLTEKINDLTYFNLLNKLKSIFRTGVTTTFTAGAKTITVVNGIITSVV